MLWQTPSFKDQKISTLVVDAHLSVGEMVSMTLNQQGRFTVKGEATSGRDGLHLFGKHRPQMVVSSLELPGMSGPEMLLQMREIAPDVQILIYTGTTNRNLIYAGLDITPQGFVHKSESLVTLVQALSLVAQNVGYFSPYSTSLLNERRQEAQSANRLQPRERTVLQLVAEGMSSKQIAHQLHLSIKTVEQYRKNIMRKLNLSSVAALTLHAVRCGLVEP